MEKLLVPVGLFLVLIVGALGEYVCGRIILPAMGLTAPEYWTWFWFMFFGLVFSAPFWALKAAFS